MAKRDGFLLHDIETARFSGSAAYNWALTSTAMQGLLYGKALEVVRLYQARVGKKTGRLAASAEASIRMGGIDRDRFIGVASINDESVVADWKGKPFWYGVYHESGTLNSRKAKRRKADGPRRPRKGYHELRTTAQQWRASP